MSFLRNIRWNLIGTLGRFVLWLWTKSTRIKVVGKEEYQKLRNKQKPVIFLVWHGRIFIVPYFFRKREIMPLISPSKDGEIAARIMSDWGYKILRGSGSHTIVKAWNEMKKELQNGGELIIVSDGPKGPNRKMKGGGIKLAQQTGAYLVPFSFSASRRKTLSSWDHFIMFKPFSKVVAIYGDPIAVDADISEEDFEKKRLEVERVLVDLDRQADRYYEK